MSDANETKMRPNCKYTLYDRRTIMKIDSNTFKILKWN